MPWQLSESRVLRLRARDEKSALIPTLASIYILESHPGNLWNGLDYDNHLCYSTRRGLGMARASVGLLRRLGAAKILQISSEQFRLPPWTNPGDESMIASDLQNTFDLWSTALQEFEKERLMADEKRNDQIIDKSELSEQELEQATGGVSAAAAVDRADASHAALDRKDTDRRR